MTQYKHDTQLRCSEIFNGYLQYDDNKVMKTIRRLFEIYAMYTRKCKLCYLLKWNFQKEMRNQNDNYLQKKEHIPFLKDNKENKSNNKEKRMRSIKEYSRNADLLKRYNSADENKNNNASYSNSLSFNIAQVGSFTISKKKNSLRLNSNNNFTYLILDQDKDKGINKDKNNKSRTKSQPQFNLKAKNIKPLNNNITNKVNKCNIPKLAKEDRNKFFNSLHEKSNRIKDNIRKLEMEKESKFNETFTFKPSLYKSKSNLKLTSVSFFKRLDKYHQIRKKKINELKEEIESQLQIPRLKSSLTSRSQEDIGEVIKDYCKKKKQKLHQMELDLFQDQGITFKPSLNDEKNKIVKDTLTIRNKNFIEMRDEKLNQFCSKEVEECTFVPLINMSSIELKPKESSDVCVRLYDYRNRYEANREYIKKYYEVNYSFKPVISKNTKKILMNKQQKKNTSLKKQKEKDLKVASERQSQEHYKDVHSNLYKHNLIDNKIKQANKAKVNIKSLYPNDLFKISVGSLSDKRALELSKMYISVDDSLEQFQKKMSKSKQYNKIINKKKNALNKNLDNKNNKKTNQLIKHLDYYDHLA